MSVYGIYRYNLNVILIQVRMWIGLLSLVVVESLSRGNPITRYCAIRILVKERKGEIKEKVCGKKRSTWARARVHLLMVCACWLQLASRVCDPAAILNLYFYADSTGHPGT